MRKKSKNIKGDVSGVMKTKLMETAEIIRGLVKTVDRKTRRKEEGGEEKMHSLRKRNMELESKLVEKERDNQRRDKEVEQLRTMIKEMKKEIGLLKGILKERIKEMKEKEEKSPKRKRRRNIKNRGI